MDVHTRRRSAARVAGLVVGAFAAYSAAYVLLFPAAGPAVGTLQVVPVIFLAWLLGTRGGVLVGAAMIAWHFAALYPAVGLAPADAAARGGWPGEASVVVLGAVFGRLGSLSRRLHAEVAARRRVEADLRESQAELEVRVRERTADLVASARALRASEERYAALVHSLRGIVWEADGRTFQFLYVSPQAEPLLGYPAERWVREPDFWLAHTHPDDVARCVAFCRDATARLRDHEFEYRMVAADGRVVWLHDVVTVEADGAGGAVRLRGIMLDVTDRKRAEADALRSGAQARAVVEAAMDCVVVIDHEGRVVEFNPAAERTFGYTRAEALGRDMSDLICPPEYREGHRAGLRRYLADGSARVLGRRVEMPAARKGGDRFVAELAIVRNPGEPPTFTGFLRDLTDRRRAEEALRGSEARLQAILDHAPAAIFVKDADGRYLLVNRRFEEVVGVGRAAAVGRTDADLLSAELAATVMANDRGVLAAGAPLEFEEAVPYPAGARTFHSVKFPLRDAAGRAYAVCGISTDVTDRKRAADALRREREFLQAVLDNVAEGIIACDATGRLTLVNWYAREVGVRDEPLGPDEWERHHPVYRPDRATPVPLAELPLVRALRGERVRDVEIAIRAATGEWHDLVASGQPLDDADGRRAGAVVALHDVTARKRLEGQFLQAQKMEAVGRLAGGVAHDFNNLLTVINGYAEVLLELLPAADPARDPVAEIRAAGERAAGLTRQLLAFSRRQVPAPRVVDLNDLVRGAERMLRRLIGEDVALGTALAPGAVYVRADPGQLEQVVMNLAVNARDAMPRGGTLTLRTRLTDAGPARATGAAAGRWAVLEAADTGEGMTPEVTARVFEPFFTTKPVGQGTGLGLAAVYGIVQEAGGDVEVDSAPGAGATFRVFLPEAPAPARSDAPRSAERTPARGTETVLVAEDEDGVRALIRQVLEAHGYAVLEAADAAGALAAAARHPGPIHLLVSDVVMPGGGASDLARALADRRGLRVLFLSGYTDDAVVRHGVQARGVNFLQKPFSPAVLARTVRDVLDAPGPAPGGPG